ncbi:MAG TPA: hypothetical protein VM660_06140, partial [Bacillus sp. (in: firmicutes)]|nr:hypothetical protein [Bacillus sp. (in: firmicutes)]
TEKGLLWLICYKSIYCINSETISLVEIDNKKNGICIVDTLDHSLGKNDCKYNKREINSIPIYINS